MLEVRGIEVSYGEFLALKGVSFTVKEGELVTIIGANGAGKSTILRAVMGLEKCRKGEILFQGEEITESPFPPSCTPGREHGPRRPEVFPGPNGHGKSSDGRLHRKKSQGGSVPDGRSV